jgi:hypothetical protein
MKMKRREEMKMGRAEDNQEQTGGRYEVVWPGGQRVAKVTPLSKRLNTLQGKTIGEVWDYLFRGDKIFALLEEELSKRYPGVKFVHYETFGPTHGGEEKRVVGQLASTLKKHGCDAVISSVGC